MCTSMGANFSKLVATTLFSGLLLVVVSNAHATLSLDYTLDSSNPQASVYYNPADPCLYGSNIAVRQVAGIDTALNAGKALAISGGVLNFKSGVMTGMTGSNIWNFAGGGSISVLGGIADFAGSSLSSVANGSTLLNGSFTSAMVTQLGSGQFKFDIVGATFYGSENQNIYSYFGLPGGSSGSEGMNLSFLADGTANNGFASTQVLSGNIVDVPTPTPVPAAAWLLGSGLMGLLGLKSRKG